MSQEQWPFYAMDEALNLTFGPHDNEIEKILSGQMSDEEIAVSFNRMLDQIPDENIGLFYKLFLSSFFEKKPKECEVAQLLNQFSEEQIGKLFKYSLEQLSNENLDLFIKIFKN